MKKKAAAAKKDANSAEQPNNLPKHHILLQVVKKINFKKLRRANHPDPDIKTFIGTNSEAALTLIFDEIILPFSHPESYKRDQQLAQEAFRIVQSIIKRDFGKLFESLILSDGKPLTIGSEKKAAAEEDIKITIPNDNEQEDISPSSSSETMFKIHRKKSEIKRKAESIFLVKILKFIGVDRHSDDFQNGVDAFKIFLTTASGDLKAFRKEDNYNEVIKGIVAITKDSGLFKLPNESQEQTTKQLIRIKEARNQLARQFIGVFTWDFRFIIKALLVKDTIIEAKSIYSVYRCLNLDQLSRTSPEDIDKFMGVFFKTIFYKTLCNPDFGKITMSVKNLYNKYL